MTRAGTDSSLGTWCWSGQGKGQTFHYPSVETRIPSDIEEVVRVGCRGDEAPQRDPIGRFKVPLMGTGSHYR